MRAGGVFVLLVGALLAAGAARLAYLERTQGESLRAQAARQQTVVRAITPLRGEILDTRGRVLAGTVQRPSIFVDPALVQDVDYSAHSIAPYLKMSPEQLKALLVERGEDRFVWLERRVERDGQPDFAEQFEATVRARRLRAFGVQYEPVRIYPQERLASHVLGFVGGELQGLAGVEQAFNERLSGRPGRRTTTVDVGRRRVSDEDVDPCVDGAAVVLTIDAYIQQIAEDRLAEQVERFDADWGVVLVMDPQGGEVLAMAVSPDYNPSAAVPPGFDAMTEEQREKASEVWRNRAVSDAYEPGSIFKPFIASLALDEGLTRIDEVFAINGPTRDFGRRTIRDTHPYGALRMHEVISKSSNIGMGLLGARCKMERLHRYVRMFGFGDVTGIEVPGEHSGLVLDFDNWNPSFSPQSVPIGQEIGATPVQLATAFCVFANGGVLYRPRVVRGLIGPNGETLEDRTRPIAVRRVLSETTCEMFRREALVETVVSGTGKAAALEDWQVFGKTGTAQIAGLQGRGYGGGYVASFIGGAPATRPQVVVLCSIYRPKKEGYYGGVVAAPVVKHVIAETLAYLQVQPELNGPPSPRRTPAAAGERRQDVDAAGD